MNDPNFITNASCFFVSTFTASTLDLIPFGYLQLKSTEELAYLVSKNLAQVIRFSTSQQLRQSCLKLLNVNNSFEAEKVICKQLIEWKTKESNDLSLVSQHGEALKEHKVSLHFISYYFPVTIHQSPLILTVE